MVSTLRVLTETHPNNRHQLNREAITAVNAVCRSKRWTSLGLNFLDPPRPRKTQDGTARAGGAADGRISI
jgi:hypothetical protein